MNDAIDIYDTLKYAIKYNHLNTVEFLHKKFGNIIRKNNEVGHIYDYALFNNNIKMINYIKKYWHPKHMRIDRFSKNW